MQTAPKFNTFYIHHHWGAQRPRGGGYTNCNILGQFAYTPRNGIYQPFSYFSRPKPGGGVYIYMVSP